MNCYRLGRQYLYFGIFFAAIYTTASIVSAWAAYWNIDGSFKYPTVTALVAGSFWLCFALLSLWVVVAYFRERLLVAAEAVTQHGCIMKRRILIQNATQVHWRCIPAGGAVIVRSSEERIKVYFDNFTRDEQEQLIAFFRDSFPAEIQKDWTRFSKTRSRQSRGGKPIEPMQPRTVAGICVVFLLSVAAFFVYCWAAGYGTRWLVVGVLHVLAALWYLWRIFKWRVPISVEISA